MKRQVKEKRGSYREEENKKKVKRSRDKIPSQKC